jgi:fatty acid desaturase
LDKASFGQGQFWTGPVLEKATFEQGQKHKMIDFVLSLVMLTAFALIAGAFWLWRRTGEVKQPLLMAVLAVIAIMNVLIWTIPTADGTAPIDRIDETAEE